MSTIHLIMGDSLHVGAAVYVATRPVTLQVGELLTFEAIERYGFVLQRVPPPQLTRWERIVRRVRRAVGL